MKHTPGPWTFHLNGDGSISILGEKISEKEYKWLAAFIPNGELWTETQLANVKLMAAAPEMLNVIEQFIHSVEHEGVIEGRVVDAVRNAK